ncbi:hypothetical protein ACFWHW_00270 [Streptomyces pharetrae]|uniref:hypothetical protein n=1 Tax=Streptomyces pharetrae TaxID=291370 RepID=UPI00365E8D9A
MTVDQLPVRVREFANYLDGLLARLDPGGGWCAVFWRRDPDGMRACLDGREIPPWDVVEALLQDLAAEHGPGTAAAEKDRARALHAAALTAHDARPGGRAALGDRLDVMLREQRYAAERLAELGRLLASAPTREAADALRRDLAWARDDHHRATARCAELRARMADFDQRTRADDPRDPHPARPAGSGGGAVPRAGAEATGRAPRPDRHADGPETISSVRSDTLDPRWALRPGAPEPGPAQPTDPADPGFAGRPDVPAPGPVPGPSGRSDVPAPGPVPGLMRRSDVPQPRRTGRSHAPAPAPDGHSPTAATPPPPALAPIPAAPDTPAAHTPAPLTSASPAPASPAPATSPPAAPTVPASPPAPEQRRRRRGGARFAWAGEEDGVPVAVPPVAPPAPVARTGRTPRGARFAGAGEVASAPPAGAEAVDAAARHETAAVVEALARLRAEGRSGEAHALLAEAAQWPAARFPLLAAELERAGLGADWATLLWETASLPAERLVGVAGALTAADRDADARQILRQGVARPAAEIGQAARALAAEGRRRELDALLAAYVRVRAPEEAARCAAADPPVLVPLLLEAAGRVSAERHRDLVHALRVAGLSA